MIEVSFPAGFTPAEATLRRAEPDPLRDQLRSPACSAKPITGTRPAHDTRCSSSKTGAARDQPSV